jgi:DNA topoisomerase-3
VYDYAKSGKPLKRLWISSMEDAAVQAGFENLKDGMEYDNLHEAALCRERADWLVGLNCTRLFSVLYGSTLNTGRVQSPTLAMLVKREADIAAFVKEPFYTPTLNLDSFSANGERTKSKTDADKVADACNGKPVTVTDIESVTKTVAPPKLYDLTSLQRDANRILGYTAQQTLDYVQSLYEKKSVSYPRTDAKYITEDMRDTVLKIIGDTDFTPDIDRIVGSVSDHHAIIPTIESRTADLSAIPSGELAIYELIRKRLIAAVSPKHVYDAVTVTLNCDGNTFVSKGKKVIATGWKTQSDDNDDDEDDANLPELSKGQVFYSFTVAVKEGTTTPPKHYTEDTLLCAMETAGAEDMPDDAERKGLGTPATRAAIIEKLIKSGLIERSKKNLLTTDKGRTLIAVLPTALTSAKMTAEWENKLKQVERGELSGDEFMDGITAFTNSIVSTNTTPKPEFIQMSAKLNNQASESLGSCPRCKSPVHEGAKGFFCDNRTCGFKIWRDSKFWTAKKKPVTAEIVAALLKDGRVAVKGLYSEKSGKKYDATVVLDDTGDKFVGFKLEFEK